MSTTNNWWTELIKDKLVRKLAIIVFVIIVTTYLYAFIAFQIAASKGEHASFWGYERNIPKNDTFGINQTNHFEKSRDVYINTPTGTK